MHLTLSRKGHRANSNIPHPIPWILACVLKSLMLHVASDAAFIPPQIFNLIRSFPLLEDLSLNTCGRHPTENANYDFDKRQSITQSSPAFTGSLEPSSHVGMDLFVSRSLTLLSGLHFRNLDLTWDRVADISTSTTLVEEYRFTLESLKVNEGATFGMSVRYLCRHR